MKLLTISFIIILIYSCSSTKDLAIKNEQDTKSIQDTLSNYILFDYINSLTEEDYYSKLDSIKKGQTKDFFSLRMAYTKTNDYSPYDSDISDSLKKAVTFIDSIKYDKALKILFSIQKHNFVNIPSHLYCGYIYKQTGDSIKSDYHYNIYDGLLNSIYESGDGISPKTAFLVITTKEEYALLDWFRLQFNRQSLINSDGYSFDLMEVTDPESGDDFEIYFNIELAFDSLRKAFGN